MRIQPHSYGTKSHLCKSNAMESARSKPFNKGRRRFEQRATAPIAPSI